MPEKKAANDQKTKPLSDNQQSIVSGVNVEGNATIKIGDVSQTIKNEYHSYGQEEDNFSQRKNMSDYEFPYFPIFEL